MGQQAVGLGAFASQKAEIRGFQGGNRMGEFESRKPSKV